MKRFIVETYNTYPYECSSICSHCRQFQQTFFLRQAIAVTVIFHKLAALSIRDCHGMNAP